MSENNRLQTSRPRILSVDFWRGFALLSIFVNHVPGNAFANFTHHRFGFSDAAEAFVLLAGVAAALAYLPKFRAGKVAETSFRIGRRVVQIYAAHILLIVACGAIVANTVLRTGDTRFLEAINFHLVLYDPLGALIGIAGLGVQPGYLNILPLYIVILAAAPLYLLIARISMPLLLALSGTLYFAAQLFSWHFWHFPVASPWFLNPLCWQFLFVIGIALGDLVRDGRNIATSRTVFVFACIYLVFAAACLLLGLWPGWQPKWVPEFFWAMDKTNLIVPRLLHVLALAYVVAYLPVETWLRRTRAALPLIVVGRHALPIFCLGTVLSIAAQMVRAEAGPSLLLDSALISGGILAQFILAGVLEWHRTGHMIPVAARV